MIDKTKQLPDYISVCAYGATGKGVADDTAAIQKAIDENPRATIYFPAGEYRISAPIRLYADRDHSNNMVLDHSARIFTNDEIDSLLFIGDKTYGAYNRWNDEGRRYIIGGIFDGDHTQKAIHLLSRPQLMRFEALKIINFEHYGFYCEQTDGIYSADFEMADSWIIGKSSFSDSECTGIFASAGDNAFSNLRIDGCVVSMDLHSGGNFVSKVHATLMGPGERTPERYNRTVGFRVVEGGFNTFEQCYADTFAYGWYFDVGAFCTIAQCNVYYWLQDDAFRNVVVSATGKDGVNVIGSTFDLPSKGSNAVLESRSGLQYANGRGEISFIGNTVRYNDTLKPTDLCYSATALQKTTVYPYRDDEVTAAEDGVWYPVCVLKAADRACYRMNVTNECDLFDIAVTYDSRGEADIDVLNAYNRSGAAYTFALGNAWMDGGVAYVTLYMKREGGTEADLALSISALNIPRAGDLFGHSLYVKEKDAVTELEPLAFVTVE